MRITKSAFAVWFNAVPKNVLFRSGSQMLERFVKETYGAKATFGVSFYQVGDKGYVMPAWAKKLSQVNMPTYQTARARDANRVRKTFFQPTLKSLGIK